MEKNILLIVLILLFIIFITKIFNIKEGGKKKRKKAAAEAGEQNEINALASDPNATTEKGDVLAWSKVKSFENSLEINEQIKDIRTNIMDEIVDTAKNYDKLSKKEKLKYIDNSKIILNKLHNIYKNRINAKDIIDAEQLKEKLDEFQSNIGEEERININMLNLYYNIALQSEIISSCDQGDSPDTNIITYLINIEIELFNKLKTLYNEFIPEKDEFYKLLENKSKNIPEIEKFLRKKYESPLKDNIFERIDYFLEIIDNFFNSEKINIIDDGMKNNYCESAQTACGFTNVQGGSDQCESLSNTYTENSETQKNNFKEQKKKEIIKFKEDLKDWIEKLKIIQLSTAIKNAKNIKDADAMFDESNSRGLIASGDSNIDIGDPGPLAPGSQPPDPNIYKADVYKMFWNDTRHDLIEFSKN